MRAGTYAAVGAAVALVLAAAGIAATARADEILLTNGTRLEGQVENPKCALCEGTGRVKCAACGGRGRAGRPGEAQRSCQQCAGKGKLSCPQCGGVGAGPGKIRVKLRAGVTMALDREDVQQITWKPMDPEELLPVRVSYERRLAKLDANSGRQQFDLGKWCHQKELEAEAAKHLRAAAELDAGTFGQMVAPLLAELDARREKRAVKALLGALALLGGPGGLEGAGGAEGGPALRAFLREHADSEIARRTELQRDLIRRQFPKLAATGADTVEAILRRVADAVASQCPDCTGSGQADCPDCKGGGKGPCPDCKGSGKGICPVCTGTGRLTCPKCYGRGKTSTGMGYGEQPCAACGGAGETACDICNGSGRAACARCRGTGAAGGACRTCAGTAKVLCARCAGSGVRRVEKLKWGPPPVRRAGVVSVVGPGVRARVWQGDCGGATITVVPAELLWRGALARNLIRLAGAGIRPVAVAVDNRKGDNLVRFRPAKGTLRAVSKDAEQMRALDLAARLTGKAGEKQAARLAAAAGDAECLPGAYVCLIAAFPSKLDLSEVADFFWVEESGQPARLKPVWFSADEVEDLRKSLN